MLELKEELLRYKPVMGLDDVESSVQNSEVRDLMELLQYLATQVSAAKE